MAATRPEHLDDARVRIALARARRQDAPWDLAAVIVRHVDVEHRLLDPLVAHPSLQAPRVHAEQRGMGPEAVPQVLPRETPEPRHIGGSPRPPPRRRHRGWPARRACRCDRPRADRASRRPSRARRA